MSGLMLIFSIILQIYNFSNSKKYPYLKNRPMRKEETFSKFIKEGKAGVLIDDYYFGSTSLKTFPFTSGQMVILWFLPIVIVTTALAV